jgi:hypothetical protein
VETGAFRPLSRVEDVPGMVDDAGDLPEHGDVDRVSLAVVGKEAAGAMRGVGKDDLTALARPKREAGVVGEKSVAQIAEGEGLGHGFELHCPMQ